MTPDENPFDKFLQSKKSKIFKNKDALLHTYTPERLPHRDEQINALVDILGVALEGSVPKNIMVYGMTGSGKTVTVKY
ncbi:MAG: cell division control protein Cdc6, partial [Thermoplasmata archaeon]